ncbi:MAG TPA: STAS domain-containing protein, partial [Isosphaeraceae bacterium]|nr:STAS domain-containing protein [Isosphaeraceae bacterium]
MAAPEFQHLSVKEVDGVAVVDFINSQLMFAADVVAEIGAELSSLITQRGYSKILLDFSHVQYLSSSMLAQLTKLQREVEQARGRLKICGLGPILQDTFRIGHFEHLFAIYDDCESARR